MITIQYIAPIPSGIRSTTEYECESLQEAEELAVSRTTGDIGFADGQPYEVAIIRRNDIVLMRYFHTIQIP